MATRAAEAVSTARSTTPPDRRRWRNGSGARPRADMLSDGIIKQFPKKFSK